MAYHKLAIIQENLDLPKHKLKQDVSTRWNSTLYKVESILEQKMALAAYAVENSIVQYTPTQLELAKRIVVVLSPVEEITQSISKETAVLSVVIPNIRVLLQSWKKHHDDQGIRSMKGEMIKSLKSRFSGIEENRLLSIATTLDPRFKDKFFTSNIIKMTVKEMLEEEIRKIVPSKDDTSQSRQESSEVRSRSPTSPVPKLAKKDTLLNMYSEILSIATILDPRFKDKFFASNIIKMTVKEMLEEEIRKIVLSKDDTSQSRQESSEVRSRSPTPPVPKLAKKDTLLNMYSEILSIATILDPRFKDKFFASNIIKMTVKEMLEEEIRKIVPSKDDTSQSRQESSEVRSRSPTPPVPKLAKKDTLLNMYSEIIEDSGTSSSNSADKFEQFLSGPLVDYKAGSPFKWWHENKARFPILAQVARRFLSRTATSMPSERLFSQAGILYEGHRNRILPENAETLLFIKGNYIRFGKYK